MYQKEYCFSEVRGFSPQKCFIKILFKIAQKSNLIAVKGQLFCGPHLGNTKKFISGH